MKSLTLILTLILTPIMAFAQEKGQPSISPERACREALIQLDSLKEELRLQESLLTKTEEELKLAKERGELLVSAAEGRKAEIQKLKESISKLEEIIGSLEDSLKKSETARKRESKLKWLAALGGLLGGIWLAK